MTYISMLPSRLETKSMRPGNARVGEDAVVAATAGTGVVPGSSQTLRRLRTEKLQRQRQSNRKFPYDPA